MHKLEMEAEAARQVGAAVEHVAEHHPYYLNLYPLNNIGHFFRFSL